MTSTVDGHSVGVTLGRVVRGEWIKLRSVRSTVIALVVAAATFVGMGLLTATVAGDDLVEPAPPGEGPPFQLADATAASLSGVMLTQLVVGVLGVLVMSGEYSTGTIRASLAAVPRRLPVLWAKAIVFAIVVFGVMVAAAFAAFFAGQWALDDLGVSASLADPGVARAVAGSAVYLTGIGVFGIATGTLLRHSAGAIATVVGVVFLLPTLSGLLLPADWDDTIGKYLPSNAGQTFMTVSPGPDSLPQWAGLTVFVCFVAASLVAAAVALIRRDA